MKFNTQGLAAAGMDLIPPFEVDVRLDPDEDVTTNVADTIVFKSVERVFPQRRLSGVAKFRDGLVFAKVFYGKRAQRYWHREISGAHLLVQTDVATPALLHKGACADDDGFFVLYEAVPRAHGLAQDDPKHIDAAVECLAKLHNAGLVHTDVHLDNFIHSEGKVYVVDADGLRKVQLLRHHFSNLGALLAQRAPEHDLEVECLWQRYVMARGDYVAQMGSADLLAVLVRKERKQRVRRYIKKTQRECTEFVQRRRFTRDFLCDRAHWPRLQRFMVFPEEYIGRGVPLKLGNSASVFRCEIDGQRYVVKRYNIKSLAHRMRRWIKRRARNAWCNGHKLAFLGIETARPIALLENRWGWFAGVCYLVMQDAGDRDLHHRLIDHPGSFDEIAPKTVNLLRKLKLAGLSHGDLKATNFVIDGDEVLLVDYDAVVEGGFDKDAARFLANWDTTPALLSAWRQLMAECAIVIVLGLSGALQHDPSAALLVDGEIVAAAEEERFVRDKHAHQHKPIQSARFCLEYAGIDPRDIDYVAFPYAPISLLSPARWHYARRYWYAPERALDALLNGNRKFRAHKRSILALGDELGINWKQTEFVPVEHHLAHASSAYHLAGFEGKCAILGVDGKGEYATTFFGYGEDGVIHRIAELYDPDSLGGLYGAITEYLGFDMLDGEYKVMGMAPYGDPHKYDMSRLATSHEGALRVNTQYVNTVGLRRHKENGQGFYFSDKLVEWLGPRRQDDLADEPYVDYAAAVQLMFEELVEALVDSHLGEVLSETGKLAFAGGGALNVKLNQRLLNRSDVDELFVQPAAGDSGTSLGAATYVASSYGDVPKPMTHVYLGPSFANDACLSAMEKQRGQCLWQKMSDPVNQTADLLAAGNPVAWFHGRMEFGPRALGGRSILGCPSTDGISDRINAQIKFRERWRPFCPSVAEPSAAEMLGSEHPAPYMTITFRVTDAWRERIPEVVHEDGTARVQVVTEDSNPRYFRLLMAMGERTGDPVLLNTSLNRRGEPMICSPADALDMFFACDLEYLVLEDWLVTKPPRESA